MILENSALNMGGRISFFNAFGTIAATCRVVLAISRRGVTYTEEEKTSYPFLSLLKFRWLHLLQKYEAFIF